MQRYKERINGDWLGGRRERELFHLLVHVPDGCSSQGGPGHSQEYHLSLPKGCRGPSHGTSAVFHAHYSTAEREVDQLRIKLMPIRDASIMGGSVPQACPTFHFRRVYVKICFVGIIVQQR